MRVVQVINSVAPARGGPTYVVTHLSRALAALGARVDVVSTRAGLDAAAEGEARRSLGDVPLHLVDVHGPARLELAPALPALLWRLVAGADVVHVHTVFTWPVALAPLVCRARRIPYVVRPAGTLDRACLALGPRRQKQLAVSAYVRGNLERAAAVQATSDHEAAELRHLAPGARVELLEVGVDLPAAMVPDRGEAGRRVGFLGRIHEKKQLDVLLRAMAVLPPTVELAVAGSGERAYVASLARLADALGVGDRVTWLGHLGPNEKRAFLDRVDVVACPSIDENFGIVVAEAMARGRPVVVTDGVQIADHVRRAEAGIVVGRNVQDLAAALDSLLANPGRIRQMGHAGREYSRAHYSWDAIAANVRTMYERVIAPSGPGAPATQTAALATDEPCGCAPQRPAQP